MPRDTSRDGFLNNLQYAVLAHCPTWWGWVNRQPWLAGPINGFLIRNLVKKTRSRPHPFSTHGEYICWESLTDRTWFGRHLPAHAQPPEPSAEFIAEELFTRPASGMRVSDKSTTLFSSFAQWFTDGILLTDITNRRKTTTNHEIDFSPLYGLSKKVTQQLRLKSEARDQRGRLKSQVFNGEEFPPFLYEEDGTTRKAEFNEVPHPLHLRPVVPVAWRRHLFAVGSDRANSTAQTAMLNTLFLREHNRICGELECHHPDWDDERVFQTARNIVMVLLIKIVVEEYINHISPYYFRFRADPATVWDAPWNKTNWFTVEFNLLYRWHSLVPDVVHWHGRDFTGFEWNFNNDPLLDVGLGPAFDATSRQKAGQIGLFNTPAFLMGMGIEAASIQQGRDNGLAPYNDYRAAMGFPRVTTFEQISGDPQVLEGITKCYRTVDDIEFYVGLFAEDARPRSAVPNLIGRMVGIDAFSQALTNPLLSRHVFNKDTFTPYGWELIQQTHTLRDVVRRVPHRFPPGERDKWLITMTQTA